MKKCPGYDDESAYYYTKTSPDRSDMVMFLDQILKRDRNWRSDRMKKINSLLLVLFITGGTHVLAEDAVSSVKDTEGGTTESIVLEKEKPASKPGTNFKQNIFYGGYINLSFGNYSVIGIEPMVGYKLTPKLSTGVKARYNYIRDERSATSHTTSTYGGSIFGR